MEWSISKYHCVLGSADLIWYDAGKYGTGKYAGLPAVAFCVALRNVRDIHYIESLIQSGPGIVRQLFIAVHSCSSNFHTASVCLFTTPQLLCAVGRQFVSRRLLVTPVKSFLSRMCLLSVNGVTSLFHLWEAHNWGPESLLKWCF